MQNFDSALPDLSWAPFQGGELEGVRPGRLCRDCRAASGTRSEARQQAICFACYRAELDHDRRLKAAAQLDTASDARFHWIGPLAPVDLTRLNALRAARAMARVDRPNPWAARRLSAVRAARLALASPVSRPTSSAVAAAARAAAGVLAVRAVRAATAAKTTAPRLEAMPPLPAAWLPFVVEDAPRQQVG